jgi:hypothetical protein
LEEFVKFSILSTPEEVLGCLDDLLICHYRNPRRPLLATVRQLTVSGLQVLQHFLNLLCCLAPLLRLLLVSGKQQLQPWRSARDLKRRL